MPKGSGSSSRSFCLFFICSIALTRKGGAQPLPRTHYARLLCWKWANQGHIVVGGSRARFLGFLGHLAELNWLIRRHVNLLVSYTRKEKQFAIRGSDSKLRCQSPTRQLRTPPHTRFRR